MQILTTHPINILVIEDNEDDFLLAEALLESKTIALTWVRTLAEAIEQLSVDGKAFNLVLLDLGVPDSQGIATFDKLRSDVEQLPPIVVLTGNDDDDLATEALQKGAEDYLVKGRLDKELALRTIKYSIDRHQSRLQLKARNRELVRLNQQLTIARDQALEANRLKSEFVANISHELRTPLAGMLGAIDVVANSMDANSENKQLLETATASGQHLLSIINDLLDFSQIETGHAKVRSTIFNPQAVVESVIGMVSTLAAEKEMDIAIEIDTRIPLVLADEGKLRQILLNLVGNAIKFTERGAVGLCANLVESKDHTAEIKFTVSDTGIGMSPEEAKAIFEPFTQVDSSNTRKYGGAGLGLSITKKLVEAMGGEIGFVSKKGKGSTFWVNLPMSTVMPEHTPDLPEAGGGHVVCPILSGDVLLVEDNKLLQLLTKRQLQKIGFSPDVVEDGRSAVEAVQTRKYKIVLMDLQLPQLDGYQATRRIREIEKTSGRRTPIVATTASAGPDDVQNCLRVGMDDVLSKPLTTEALATALSKWSLKETD